MGVLCFIIFIVVFYCALYYLVLLYFILNNVMAKVAANSWDKKVINKQIPQQCFALGPHPITAPNILLGSSSEALE